MSDPSLQKRRRRPRYHGSHPRAFHDKYKELDPERYAAEITGHINAEAARAGVAICAQYVGSAAQIFAGVSKMERFSDIAKTDKDMVLAFTSELLLSGVFTLPRGLMYFSSAHTDADIAATKAGISAAMSRFAARTAA